MIKARNKKFSLIMALIFAFTMVFPMGLAFAGENVTFSKALVSGLKDDPDNGQPLGFVKISDISVVDLVYVTVKLPDGVEYKTPEVAGTSTSFISGVDSNGNVLPFTVVDAAEDEITAWVDGSALFAGEPDDAYIKVNFNSVAGSDVLIKSNSDDQIKVNVTVKAIEDTIPVWSESGEFLVGLKGEKAVSIEAASPKAIKVGSGQQIAKITVSETAPGAFKPGDTITLTLPSDEFAWVSDMETANYTNYYTAGTYGLDINDIAIDDEELTITFSNSSSLFGDELELKLQVNVLPGADDGDIEIEVTSDLDNADLDDTTLVVATVGDVSAELSVDDTADDTIYPASHAKEIDQITIDPNGDLDGDDYITLTLSEGAVWDGTVNNAQIAAINGLDSLVGRYNDDRSLWIDLKGGADDIEIEGLKIATLPDVELGDITVTVGGAVEGTVVVGEVVAAAEVKADVTNVALAALDQAAGDITITELKKKGLNDADKYLILELPTGVFFAGKPTVKVNGDEVGSGNLTLLDDDQKLQIDKLEDFLSDTKIDEIVISDIEYDIDTRVRGGDIEVKISGGIVNRLDDADINMDDIDWADYSGDAVFTVVNATTVDESVVAASFTVGDEGVAIQNGRTLVQVNMLCDVLGLQKSWDSASKTAYFVKDGKVVAFPMGENAIYINGVKVPQDQGGVIINGYTYATLRGIQAAFGGELAWDGATKTATFNFDK